ncbi:hypothetical protein [Streptomyces sp. NPDC094469]|uniref:hypothetical protein n=1 Tax=Streptomyces sp. NPDC094469 TaxID=3366067 RepID=UPI0038013104
MFIVNDAQVPTRDHTPAKYSENCLYSTNHQVVMAIDTRLVLVVGQKMPRHCRRGEESTDWQKAHKQLVQRGPRPRRTGLARVKCWWMPPDYRLKCDDVHRALLSIACLRSVRRDQRAH